MTEVTPEPVGFPDEEGVVLAECFQARRQVRTVVHLPGSVILIEAPWLDSDDHECIPLKIGALRSVRLRCGFLNFEAAIGWEALAASIAQAKKLTRPAATDHLARVSTHFTSLRRYTPAFLAIHDLHAAPAAHDLLAAINVIRTMNITGARKVPDDVPTSFIRPRWKPLVFTDDGTDQALYEFGALSELKNALRSGDMWVTGSRQFRDFDDYLLVGPRPQNSS